VKWGKELPLSLSCPSSRDGEEGEVAKNGADAGRILVLEDEPVIGRICQRVLAGERFEVDVADNGRAARDMLAKKAYDLYLLDVKTPVMSGIELYRWLEEERPQLISRVIFTSGSVMAGDTMAFIENTGKPFLPKPFTPEELLSIVRGTLEGLAR
jgi:DNA-binding response OmpR family regulator